MRLNIKKALNRELDTIVPRTLNSKDCVESELSFATDNGSTKITKGIPFRVTIISLFLAIITFVVCWFTIPLFKSKPFGGNVIVLEINPCVKVVSDEDEKVVSVISQNSDGDMILFDLEQEQLLGKSSEEVVLILIDKAIELDFISESKEQNKVNISVLSEKGSDDLAKRLKDSALEYLLNNGIYGIVEGKPIAIEEYTKKYEQVANTVKEVFDTLKDTPKFTYEREENKQEELLERYLEEYKNFLQQLTLSYCDIISQKYNDLLNISGLVEIFDGVSIDLFAIGDHVPEFLRENYEQFNRLVKSFEIKYNETLSRQRYEELLEDYSGFGNIVVERLIREILNGNPE